jgi:anti-sigma regulatory factor (Ser/Thr protein kinase)
VAVSSSADVVTQRRTFDSDPASVASARRFVSGVLAGVSSDGVLDAAVLLTSEVVSNAILHARSAPTVTVTASALHVRVEIADGSSVLPVRKRYGAQATTGRGLLMLETLAASWGAEPAPDGKCVWFELDEAGPIGAAFDRVTLTAEEVDAISAGVGEAVAETTSANGGRSGRQNGSARAGSAGRDG